MREAAAVFRVDRTRIYAAMRNGLRWSQADVWAIRAGFHPSEVWPEWLDVGDQPSGASRVSSGDLR
jgi:hypothetical protein